MYTNNLLEIIEDSQLAIVGTNAEGIYPVTITQQPEGKVITGRHIENLNGTRTLIWEYREKTADELLAEKQALLDQIEKRQYEICSNNSDLWAIKFQDSEYDDDLTAAEKKANKDLNKKVIAWRKNVRAQNNGITTDNTKEEIQARLDNLTALEASYPEI